MGGSNNWRTNVNTPDWMRDVEKRILHEERRPPASAETIFGPGWGLYSTQLDDWNDVSAIANGFWYSQPGALHAPDCVNGRLTSALWWLGRTQGIEIDLGYGLQWATQARPPANDPSTGLPVSIDTPVSQSTYIRRFYDPGVTGIQTPYTPWQIEDGNQVGSIIMYAAVPLPNGYLVCDGSVYDPILYPMLYTVIGNSFGGTPTAPLLPDTINRFPRGWSPTDSFGATIGGNEGQTVANRSPRHTHGLASHQHNSSGITAGTTATNYASNTTIGGAQDRVTGIGGVGSANHTHSITGLSGLPQPNVSDQSAASDFPYFYLRFLIKAI